MRIPTFSNLYGRIFAIFWFTILVVLVAVLIVQESDPRQMHLAPKINIERLAKIGDYIEYRYKDFSSIDLVANDMNQERRERKENDRDDKRPSIYITDINGNLLSHHGRMQQRIIQNFITSVSSFNKPSQRLYGNVMVAGPVKITVANQPVLLFSSSHWDDRPPFLFMLIDQPIKFLLVVMLVSAPLLLWLAYALSLPARRLERAARRVANGEFIEDPSLEKGTSEFREAGAAFNKMVLAINQMISGHQRLLSDISHELRSPLTRLRMANALAKRKQGESNELLRIDTEAERLEKMIGELLELSRMQVNSHQVREQHTAASLWNDLLEDAQFEAEQIGKSLTFNTIPEASFIGNPNLLMSALENIIRNAILYSKKQIEVNFSLKKDTLSISVEDDGDGVPEQELADIFKPFYRVSTARDRHSGGTGLGLAITESAVRQHNGRIQAENRPSGGLKMTITLPVHRP